MEKSASSITSTLKGSVWSITINNPTEEDKANWVNAKQSFHWINDISGQLEKGAEGTLHIQGMLKTKQVRFSQVKKAFPRAHIELAKNATALAKYVTKSETRISPIRSSILYCTPAHIQKALYDSCIALVCDNTISMAHDDACRNTYFKFAPRLHSPVIDRKDFFIAKVTNASYDEHHKWVNYFRERADYILKDIYNDMIKQGYYGVEFISANNLQHGAFKKHLLSILIRHALHSPEENPAQEDDESETQVEALD